MFLTLLVYVVIIASKLQRLEAALTELSSGCVPVAELLFWSALLAYVVAAVAYFGETRAPGRSGRLATWGVRVGWLAQSALLVAQAARADGFPWATWAGSLNLFVWFVVSAYLIWGCRARFRLLGLAVTPLVAALFVVARLGGGTELGARSDYSNLFLVLHVGLVLAAFAGFTLAAGLAALYLFQERRLKRHDADPARAGPAAADARRARRPDDRDFAAGADARHGRRARPARGGRRRGRRADGRHARDLARLRRRTSRSGTRTAGRADARRTSRSRRSRSSIVVRLALPATHFA